MHACHIYIRPSQGEFITKVTILKEKLSSKENEVHGKWMTEDRMKKSGQFSPQAIKSMIQYCGRFPEQLTRPERFDYIYNLIP